MTTIEGKSDQLDFALLTRTAGMSWFLRSRAVWEMSVSYVSSTSFSPHVPDPGHPTKRVFTTGAKYLIGPGALEEVVRAAIARNAALPLGAAGRVERAERFLSEG